MKNIIIVINSKQIYLAVAAIITVIATLIIILTGMGIWKSTEAALSLDGTDLKELQEINSKLKGKIDSILPDFKTTVLEDHWRNKYQHAEKTPDINYKIHSLPDVASKGTPLPYRKTLERPDYLRPIYDPEWTNFYFRGWLQLTEKNINARHRLFTFYGGGSNIFDFIGTLSFEGSVGVDYHSNINFLVYHFKVNNVKHLENQIVLFGEPQRAGAEIITIALKNILPVSTDSKDFLFQLSTPTGDEIDFEYGGYSKSDYYKKQYEQETTNAFETLTDPPDVHRLQKENELLLKELSNYVPLENNTLKEDQCKSGKLDTPSYQDLKRQILSGSNISYRKNYYNPNYLRPLYDPEWKINIQEKWSYIPDQICFQSSTLFSLPRSSSGQNKLLGVLGFHERFKSIPKGYTGFLIYNFKLEKAIATKNKLLLVGTPQRQGATVIQIKSSLLPSEDYTASLVTSDGYEVDYLVNSSAK